MDSPPRSRGARRAEVVLLASAGLATAQIARQLRLTDKTVRLWRRRFAELASTSSLQDLPRSGRPSSVRPEVRAKLVSLACQRPKDDKTPFRLLWTRASLRIVVLPPGCLDTNGGFLGCSLGGGECVPDGGGGSVPPSSEHPVVVVGGSEFLEGAA